MNRIALVLEKTYPDAAEIARLESAAHSRGLAAPIPELTAAGDPGRGAPETGVEVEDQGRAGVGAGSFL